MLSSRNTACGAVCLVGPIPPPLGGMSIQMQRLARGLERSGVAVVLVPTNPAPPVLLRWTKYIPGVRTAIREFQFLLSLWHGAGKAQVLHHLSASGFYFFAHTAPVLAIARMRGLRSIVNYRGGMAQRFLQRWRNVVLPLVRRSDVLAVPSEFLKEIFGQHGVEAEILPNIADVETFRFKDREQLRPLLLTTRNLEPIYGVDCALKAFQIVQQRYPSARLTIAGVGSEAMNLEKLARTLGLEGVRFAGAVRNDALSSFYAAHDIYLNMSRVDNFPGALVEAACCGLPIVTTTAGGIRNMIRNGENGLCVEVDDYKGAARAVCHLLEEQQLARSIAVSAARWASQFSWNNVCSALMRLYQFATEVPPESISTDAWAAFPDVLP